MARDAKMTSTLAAICKNWFIQHVIGGCFCRALVQAAKTKPELVVQFGNRFGDILGTPTPKKKLRPLRYQGSGPRSACRAPSVSAWRPDVIKIIALSAVSPPVPGKYIIVQMTALTRTRLKSNRIAPSDAKLQSDWVHPATLGEWSIKSTTLRLNRRLGIVF